MDEHPVFESVGDTMQRTHDEANRLKISRTIRASDAPALGDADALERAISVHEIAIADYWSFAFDLDPANSAKRRIFHRTCSECFSLMEACPIPENSVQMMVHVLKMLAYAYMGEKWEGMRRFLKEHRAVLMPAADSRWDHALLAGIYEAAILLAEKTSFDDMSRSRKIIADLRERQKSSEESYLNGVSIESRARAAYQLASLYHLAKSVDLVGEYMLQGTPDDADARLDYHFEKALSHGERAGVIELDILLRMLHAAFRKMTYNSIWVAAKVSVQAIQA